MIKDNLLNVSELRQIRHCLFNALCTEEVDKLMEKIIYLNDFLHEVEFVDEHSNTTFGHTSFGTPIETDLGYAYDFIKILEKALDSYYGYSKGEKEKTL